MTSGHFQSFPVDQILIHREERQRRTLSGIGELAESIARTGLIHPIVITREGVLIAGERRLTAVKTLGWTSIPAQFVEDLDPLALQLLELEENTRRLDIDWRDRCAAVKKYHDLQRAADPAWTALQTAAALGMSSSSVSEMTEVSKALDAGHALVAKAQKYSQAKSVVQRNKARAKTTALNSLFDEAPTASTIPIINEDFITWAASYEGPKFNFLHCDFPYGITVGGKGQAADRTFGNYSDDPQVYWTLLEALGDLTPRLVDNSAHLMFWFSMKHYRQTFDLLQAQGWRVNPFPLVWYKSDNSGIVPDHKLGPRRVYETAFHCFRGDRPVAQVIANAIASPNTKTIHMSEKPLPVLEHFFRLYVDNTTRLLDPTCGSANSLKAGLRRGALSVLGIERDPEFYSAACDAWDSSKQLDMGIEL